LRLVLRAGLVHSSASERQGRRRTQPRAVVGAGAVGPTDAAQLGRHGLTAASSVRSNRARTSVLVRPVPRRVVGGAGAGSAPAPATGVRQSRPHRPCRADGTRAGRARRRLGSRRLVGGSSGLAGP
jgi:hypothetical protein